ncbi:MAG TPA: sulfotransferase [Rhodopila sp.]|nr:sulfotransferase [Rhodopila sp.]
MLERFDDAAACYRRVLALEPRMHLAHFGLGMARLGQKNFAAAATELKKFVAIERNSVDGHANLGTALSEMDRHAEAIPHLEQALALRPGHAVIQFKCGIAYARKGDYLAAARHLQRAVALDPAMADAYFQLGIVLGRIDRLDEAVQALRDALKLRPDMVPALYELGQALNNLQAFEEAEQQFEKGLALDPESPALYLGLARTRHLEGRCAEARALVGEALVRKADAADCYTTIGQIHQSEGHFAEAIAALQKAISIRPTHGNAQLCLTMLRKPEGPEARIADLQRIRRAASLDKDQLATLNYALAKEYENLGDHAAAFEHYRSANDLRMAMYPPESYSFDWIDDRLIRMFGTAFLADKAGCGNPSERPVFIVGMMRSGTTLVEQILSSHPAVHGHGELDDIRRIVHGLTAKMPPSSAYPEGLADLTPAMARPLAETYLARLEREAPSATRSIDKRLHNFEYLGMIALLFPHARIIHCTRDPIDTCLSNYFHDFGSQNRVTCDLKSLGQFFLHYQRLMAHWESVLPNPILRIPYEDLIADQEGWSRKAIAFLDLPWDDRCLSFYENDRPVYTYSLWQVRQPIYRTSLQRWRPYARFLGPLFDALQQNPTLEHSDADCL